MAKVLDEMPKEVAMAPGQASKDEQEMFNDPTGKYKLVMKGAYGAIEAAILPGDSLKAETGSMVAMSENVHLEAKIEGSAAMACFRSCFAGEDLFMSHFSLKGGSRGDVLIAPAMPGDVAILNISPKTPAWCVQSGSFLLADSSVKVGVRTQNCMQCCFSNEGLFVLKCHGGPENTPGRVIVSSYGGIVRYDLQPGEVRKIDNGYLVAWENHMNYTITKASSSILSSVLSGEGLCCAFTGPGTIYVQTRSVKPLAKVIASEMGKK